MERFRRARKFNDCHGVHIRCRSLYRPRGCRNERSVTRNCHCSTNSVLPMASYNSTLYSSDERLRCGDEAYRSGQNGSCLARTLWRWAWKDLADTIQTEPLARICSDSLAIPILPLTKVISH